MNSAPARSGAAPSRRAEPSRRTGIEARLNHRRLDRELAAGIAPWRSPQIQELILELRSVRPVRAEGIARLRMLLCDGGGPLYAHDRAQALAGALEQVTQWLPAQE